MAKLVHLKHWEEDDTPFHSTPINSNIRYRLTSDFTRVTCKECKKTFEMWKADVLNEFKQMILDVHNHISQDELVQVMNEIFVQKVMDA